MPIHRLMHVAAGVALLLVLTACGSQGPTTMPDVVGKQLDVAKSDIERAGFGGDVEVIGGGLFGVIDEGNWVVCEQEPTAGETVSEPRLVVDRECEDGDVQPDSSPEPTEPPAAPTADAAVADTTVDDLLDLLNSADMGGIQVGDRFRFTGELFESDAWMTGAVGGYAVYFKAHGGADDLLVLVDESDAANWTDGTMLEIVVENAEIEVNGEMTDGWLRMVSARTLP